MADGVESYGPLAKPPDRCDVSAQESVLDGKTFLKSTLHLRLTEVARQTIHLAECFVRVI